VEGIPPGTVLAHAEFPEDLTCPWCSHKPTFRNANGLRGHAHGKHGIRWDTPRHYKQYKGLAELAADGALTEPEDRETLEPWHMIAITQHELFGLSFNEVARRMGRSSGDYLKRLARSKPGLSLQEKLHSLFDSPDKIATFLLKANAIDVTMDFLAALEWAKDARDYIAVHKMTKDLLTFAGLGEKKEKSDDGSKTIHLHLDLSSLSVPEVKTSYELLEAEIEEEEV
jgi:hypothetical protein